MACPHEDGGGQGGEGDRGDAKMADPILVSEDDAERGRQNGGEQQTPHTTRDGWHAPDGSQDEIVRAAVLVGRPEVGLSPTAESLIAQSTRKQTKVKYASIERKWTGYCSRIGCDTRATTNTFANFLAEEFKRDLKYTYIRSYTAALAGYIKDVDHIILNKLLKGIHNNRPPRPRYAAVWDVNLVLNYIGAMITTSFMDITLKTTALLMLLSGNRVNMLSHFCVDSMLLTDECTFLFKDVLKHTRP